MSHEGQFKPAEHDSESGKDVVERDGPWSLWRAWLFLAAASFALWSVIVAGVLAFL